jgi:hypothetical protein
MQHICTNDRNCNGYELLFEFHVSVRLASNSTDQAAVMLQRDGCCSFNNGPEFRALARGGRADPALRPRPITPEIRYAHTQLRSVGATHYSRSVPPNARIRIFRNLTSDQTTMETKLANRTKSAAKETK